MRRENEAMIEGLERIYKNLKAGPPDMQEIAERLKKRDSGSKNSNR